MKKSIHISATFDQPDLLADLVEKLAYRRNDLGYGTEKMPDGRKALETSSTETYVSGTIIVNESGEQIHFPFITCFLFTCTKEKNKEYKLAWGRSLS